MPLTLILRSSNLDSDKAAPALTFDGPRIVIGRGAGCDVRLPDPSVSHRHATLRTNGPAYQLVDEGSTNGTYVGEARLNPQTPRPVKTGDMIRVGRVWLEARVDQTPPTRDLAIATRDLALALVSQAMRALGDDAVTKVRVVEGPDTGAMFALEEEGRLYTIGRDERCDLPLADADASREHAQVVRRGGTVMVRDMGSKNGVTLGQSRMPPARDLVWRAGTFVRIGKTALTLDEPAAAALAELEEAEDEAMAADEVPPMPSPSGTHVPLAPAGTNTGGAPIADFANASKPSVPVPARMPKHRWSATDLAVVFAALAVMGLSIAGLVWLLRG